MSTGLTVVKNTCPTFPTGLFGLLNMMALVLLVNLLASSFSSSFQSWLVTTPSFFVWKFSTKTELRRFKHSFHSNMFILLPCFPIFLFFFFSSFHFYACLPVYLLISGLSGVNLNPVKVAFISTARHLIFIVQYWLISGVDMYILKLVQHTINWGLKMKRILSHNLPYLSQRDKHRRASSNSNHWFIAVKVWLYDDYLQI